MIEQTDHFQMPRIHEALQAPFKERVTRLTSVLTRSCEGLAALQGEPPRNKTKHLEAEALVAALTQTMRELGACAQEAQDAHDQHVRFLTMIAHELRNPLSPIKTAAMLLGTGPLDQKRLDRIKTVIEFQVAHLARLIDDLMAASRSPAANFQLTLHRLDLTDVLDKAVQMCLPIMHKRRQHLVMQIPSHAVMMNGDATRLVQVFSNLLDNASKYTPNDGEIRLTVTKHNHSVHIAVRDTGIGIRAQAMPFIFDLYTQGTLTPDAEHRGPGFGIGLYVVRNLIEAHSGHVAATSAGANLGSEFLVTLPLDVIKQAAVAE